MKRYFMVDAERLVKETILVVVETDRKDDLSGQLSISGWNEHFGEDADQWEVDGVREVMNPADYGLGEREKANAVKAVISDDDEEAKGEQ